MEKIKLPVRLRRVSCFIFLAVLGLGIPAASASPIDDLKQWLSQPREHRVALKSASFAVEPNLTRDQAATAEQLLWDDHVAEFKATRQEEWDGKAITIGEHTLKLLEKHFGQKPAHGWNLFISMHGGGGAPPAVNDQQWHNQIKLYQPANSLYVCPRAATDTWDLWHQSHIDGLFDRLIQDAIVLGDVDPNHVYVMGYSAGGDGVYRLATRMADRWAAAAMMAGHPGDVSPLSLRNIGFIIRVGENDGGPQGYYRNDKATEWGKKLADLRAADPQGYDYDEKLEPGKPHWMDLKDAVAVPWMEKFTRNPLPEKVVWMQGDKPHDRSYWLATPADQAKKGQLVIATRKGQHIEIEKIDHLNAVTVLLNDKMLDLDKPVTITMQGKPLFSGVVRRTIARIEATTLDRGDPDLIFSASQTVSIE